LALERWFVDQSQELNLRPKVGEIGQVPRSSAAWGDFVCGLTANITIRRGAERRSPGDNDTGVTVP
jgi:hypothetical protein